MDEVQVAPGPAADYAFRLGMLAGGILGLGCIGLLYWIGTLPVLQVVYLLVVIFPVYLVVVAVVLSVWLGYDKGVLDLRPVYRPRE